MIKCFICSEAIIDKKTMEHIIADSLLGKLGIKEKTLDGAGEFLYGRIKVPAHSKCNSEFGSRYENKILSLLDNPEELFKTLELEENLLSETYTPSEEVTSLITTWLSKYIM